MQFKYYKGGTRSIKFKKHFLLALIVYSNVTCYGA
jgi:hypothetical protein